MADVTATMVTGAMMMMMGGDWRYKFGGEVGSFPNDPAKKRLDCSEATEAAVRWAAESVGSTLRLTDGSFSQHDACYRAGTLVPLAQARDIPGSLIFLSRVNNVTPGMGRAGIYHVGLVLSPAMVLEACCKDGDVVRPVSWSKRAWYKMGGLIPGVVYGGPAVPPVTPPVQPPSSSDVVLQVDGGGTVGLRMLKKGLNGRDVRQYQALLSEWGISPGTHDGDFGSKTDSATRQAQTSWGLVADGICGEKTWTRALGS